jgi:hypothetical protein
MKNATKTPCYIKLQTSEAATMTTTYLLSKASVSISTPTALQPRQPPRRESTDAKHFQEYQAQQASAFPGR